MKLLLSSILFTVFVTFSGLLQAQVFGGFKPDKKWQQLNTDKYRIIYPSESVVEARKAAAIIDRQYFIDDNIGLKRDKIDIVLQNSTTQANGYVGLAPFISEFFLTPPSNSTLVGSLPWSYTLAVHEYQHVLQYSNSKRGITKLGYYFGGEQIWAAFQAFSIPNWFFEGDAVRAETQYSEQGRGRIPYFFNAFRAYSQQGKFPTYDKLRNGSIRDFYPDHYRFGYLMAAYGKSKYGNQFWPTVLEESSKYKGIVYPFSRALKRNSGFNSTNFYKNTVAEYSQKWENSKNNIGITHYQPKKHEVVNFQFPLIKDSALYYYAGTYDKIGKIYKKEGGTTEAIKTLAIRNSNYFDLYDDNLLITQQYVDKRWGWNDYQDIVVYNLTNKKSNRLTYNGKYFHPSFSPNGENIVANYSGVNHKFHLEIININTAKAVRLNNPENLYFSFPIYKNDSTIISATRDTTGRMSLTEINLTNQTYQQHFTGFHIIGKPNIANGKVYFSASFSGIDNLYEWNGKSLKQLTKNGSGRYQVSTSEDSIYFSEFSLQGNILRSSKLPEENNNFEIKPLAKLPYYHQPFFNDSLVIPTTITPSTVESKKYSKGKNLINLHSWSLTAEHPEYSIQLNSDNVLNTLDLSAGYTYNTNEERGGIDVDFLYGQYFLQFNGNFSRVNRRVETLSGNEINFTESKITSGFILPLNYSSNTFSRRFRARANYQYSTIQFDEQQFQNESIHASILEGIYQQQKIKARKNIFTHFGFYHRVLERKAFNEDAFQLLLQNSLALRGLAQNHNLVLDADAQFENTKSNYRFSDIFNYPRGFDETRFAELYKIGANYHFPIFYPDRGIPSIAYILRIRGNIFYDYGITANADRELNSTGAELIFDTKLLRLFTISLGVRFTQTLSQKSISQNNGESSIEIFFPLTRF